MNASPSAQRTDRRGGVRFRLLGAPELVVGGEPAVLAPKERLLLAVLLLHANEPVPADRLVDVLWGDEPPASARHALQVYASRLRRLLGDRGRLESRARAYVLRVDPDELDLARFRSVVEEAREAAGDDAGSAADGVREALALWDTRPLEGLADAPGVRELVTELEEERLAACELWVRLELEAGRPEAVIPELERLLAEQPAREQLHADLMLALVRIGKPVDALAAYERARELLLTELGLEPGPRLEELAAAIRRGDPALMPVRTELLARRHLPAQPNQFIGRERELGEVLELVRSGRRTVTLTGAGGIGKTRLAIAAAEHLAAEFDDGAWFVDLSPLADPASVLPATAQALGIEAAGLEDYLAEKRLLLVLDNCEHVVEAAPAFGRLLRRAPGLAVLATSRSPLGLSGELEFRVPPLPVPEPHARVDLSAVAASEAVRLLVARARATTRGFELTAANGRDLAEICVTLDGLPLAIELAGARLGELSPGELRARLESALAELVHGPADVPDRQRTMRAAVEWSYGLLDESERGLFMRLGVFSGDFGADAAAKICRADERGLRALSRKSLLQEEGSRYRMLLPIRELALEQLQSRQERSLRRAHARYFTAFAEAIEGGRDLKVPDPALLDELGREYDELRAALDWSQAAAEHDLFSRLTVSLAEFWSVRGPFGEARRRLEAALAVPGLDPERRLRVHVGLGLVCSQQGDWERALSAREAALAEARALGDRATEASCLGNLGGAMLVMGERARARELFLESRRLAQEVGNDLTLSGATNVLGVLELVEGRLEEAERWFEESLEMSERIHHKEGASTALLNLGVVALAADRLADAQLRFREALQLVDELGHPRQRANCLAGLAARSARLGDHAEAARLLGEAHAALEGAGAELEPYFAGLEAETLALLNEALGEDAAAAAVAEGRRTRLEVEEAPGRESIR